MDNMKHRRLQELDRSDFGFVEGEPDIRGWDVKNASGQKIGEVEELIIDAHKSKVRYMVVELDDDDLDLEDDKKVLIPIGLAELDKDDDDVILSSVTVEQLKALPAYEADHLDDDVERNICSAFERGSAPVTTAGQTEYNEDKQHNEDQPNRKRNALIIDTPTSANAEAPSIGTPEYYASFYQHPHFNDENLSRNRQQESKSQQTTTDPDYERGLRLWEMRSEGGIVPTNTNTDTGGNRDFNDDRRKENVRSRRAAYEEQRNRKGKTIIDRINDEGMQDA